MEQPVEDRDLITGQTDDPLDEIARDRRDETDRATQTDGEPLDGPSVRVGCGDRRAGRGGEDDDVATLRFPEAVAELLDDDAVIDGERRLHRGRRDEEDLRDERAQQQRDDDRDGEERQELGEQPTPTPARWRWRWR